MGEVVKGEIMKLGRSFGQRWKARYFVLTIPALVSELPILHYYDKPGEEAHKSNIKGTIPLTSLCRIRHIVTQKDPDAPPEELDKKSGSGSSDPSKKVPDKVTNNTKYYCFTLSTPEREFYLGCLDRKEREKWLKAIHRALIVVTNRTTRVEASSLTMELHSPSHASTLISMHLLSTILKHVPERFVVASRLKLIFNSSNDGTSMQRMLSKCREDRPTLFIILDEHENVFGGYASGSLLATNSFQGSSESFLFYIQKKKKESSAQKNGDADEKIGKSESVVILPGHDEKGFYHCHYSQNAEDYIFFGVPDPALRINADMVTGMSFPSSTFKNASPIHWFNLSEKHMKEKPPKNDFKILVMEVYSLSYSSDPDFVK